MFSNCVEYQETPHVPIIYGVHFVLQMDHKPLTKSTKFTNNRLMWWAMFLQSYNIKVEATKGSDSIGTDYLCHKME